MSNLVEGGELTGLNVFPLCSPEDFVPPRLVKVCDSSQERTGNDLSAVGEVKHHLLPHLHIVVGLHEVLLHVLYKIFLQNLIAVVVNLVDVRCLKYFDFFKGKR